MKYAGKTVQIMAMSECPNKCKHCFVEYTGHIPIDELDRMLNNYVKIYDKVIINGTELLMNEKYIELCQKYGQDFIYTNGRLLTPETRIMLKKHGIRRLSISLHYGIQDKISNIDISEISQKIRETVGDGFEVRVLCNISKDNYKMVPEIAEYVYSLGARGIKFINLIKEGKGKNYVSNILSKQEIDEFFFYLNNVRKKYEKEKFYISRNGGFGNDERRKNNFKCPAGSEWVTLLPDHSVHPCNGLLYSEYKIGEWDENAIYINEPFEHDCKYCTVLGLQL